MDRGEEVRRKTLSHSKSISKGDMIMEPEFVEMMEGRDGLYCDSCGTVIYVDVAISSEVAQITCPVCGGHLLWIADGYHPSPCDPDKSYHIRELAEDYIRGS